MIKGIQNYFINQRHDYLRSSSFVRRTHPIWFFLPPKSAYSVNTNKMLARSSCAPRALCHIILDYKHFMESA